MWKYTENLRGIEEVIFRQGTGKVAHITINVEDYLNALRTNTWDNLRISTLCGKSLKYQTHETYGSQIGPRSKWVRNACIDCWLQWEPESPLFDRRKLSEIGDLPF